METTNRGQENRYLESPYTIKDTGTFGQMPFSTKSASIGGFSFSKKSFVSGIPQPYQSRRDGKSLEAEKANFIEIEGL